MTQNHPAQKHEVSAPGSELVLPHFVGSASWSLSPPAYCGGEPFCRGLSQPERFRWYSPVFQFGACQADSGTRQRKRIRPIKANAGRVTVNQRCARTMSGAWNNPWECLLLIV